MEKDARVLLSLLAIALGRNPDFQEEHVDWLEVMKLAVNQGVRAVAYEGLERIKTAVSKNVSFPDKTLLMHWYAGTIFVEREYATHLHLAQEIASVWKSRGIRTIVFKGLAHSRLYPKPEHREFGDFDCFLIDDKGRPAYRKGNEVAKEMGLTVDDEWYKHSEFNYKKLSIENHRFFTSARRGGTDKALNEYLLEAIGDGSNLENADGTELLVLPVEAEGLFMLYHSLTHFLVEGIKLRYLVDWACWIKVYKDKICWPEFYAQCQKFRLDGFVDVLNTIAVKYLGIEWHDKSVFCASPYAERTIECALYEDSSIYNLNKGRWYERFHVMGNALKYSWKFRDVARYSMMRYIWQFAYGFIVRKEEE